MKRKYSFELNHNSDIVLATQDRKYYNLGYNYNSRIPLVPWAYTLQVTGEDLFNGLKVSTHKERLDEGLTELVAKTLYLLDNIPLPADDFNREIQRVGVGRFYAGNNKTRYSWILREDRLLYLAKDETDVLTFSPEDCKKFVSDYFDFLNEEIRLEVARTNLQEIIRNLRKGK